MKHKKFVFAAVLMAVILSASSLVGCTNAETTSSEVSAESSTVSVQESENVSIQESESEPSENPREKELNEIKVLTEYRSKLEKEKTRTFFYTEKKVYQNSVSESEEKEAEVEYIDAAIRDVNDDGHYEMIVKYKARGTDITGNLDSDWAKVTIYDIVTVVDGKAVESEHYTNEEGFYNHGAAK